MNQISNEGILRKISSGKLRGTARIGWNALDFYHGLEAVMWLICGGIFAVKGMTHLLLWLF